MSDLQHLRCTARVFRAPLCRCPTLEEHVHRIRIAELEAKVTRLQEALREIADTPGFGVHNPREVLRRIHGIATRVLADTPEALPCGGCGDVECQWCQREIDRALGVDRSDTSEGGS